MPKGAPDPLDITSRRLSAFTLDTSVIEAAGFNFANGPLKMLANQLPPWMMFAISSVVEQEVLKHRLAHVEKAEMQIKSGYQDLRRHGGAAFASAEPVRKLDFVTEAASIFEDQLTQYMNLFRSIHIPLTGAGLAEEVFRLYFNAQPPFGGASKKHEFPDAAILLSLEEFARSRQIQLLAVSKDDGWGAFAERSDFIYRVKSIEELAELFENRTPNAISIGRKLTEEFSQPNAALTRSIKQFLQGQRDSIQWAPKPWHNFAARIDASIVNTEILSAVPQADSVRVWLASGANESCVAQVSVIVQLRLTVDGFLFERTAAGWREIAFNAGLVDQQLELPVFLEFAGNLLGQDVSEWSMAISLGNEIVSVDMGKAPFENFKIPGRSLLADFDDLDSDIPF